MGMIKQTLSLIFATMVSTLTKQQEAANITEKGFQ